MANESAAVGTPPVQGGQSPAVPAASGGGEQKKNLTTSERFTALVMRQFSARAGVPDLSEYQKRLVQGYFVAIDRALKVAEEERVRRNANNRDHSYDNNLPFTWDNVNAVDLALDVVHYARMGLDMMQENHLFPIPYKNKKTGKYDMTLMPGYNGIQYIAMKYAVEQPKFVTVELVYSTDTFTPIKKSRSNPVESYEFTINNPFNRGSVVGGFGYIEYADPGKNQLVIMTLHDIEKRKPKSASTNFWGGTQTVWENGTKTTQEAEGWFEEMCLRTIKRVVYSAKHIPRDPMKIDESYQHMKLREARIAEMEAETVIETYANGEVLDVSPGSPPIPPELPSAPAQELSVQTPTDTRSPESAGGLTATPDEIEGNVPLAMEYREAPPPPPDAYGEEPGF